MTDRLTGNATTSSFWWLWQSHQEFTCSGTSALGVNRCVDPLFPLWSVFIAFVCFLETVIFFHNENILALLDWCLVVHMVGYMLSSEFKGTIDSPTFFLLLYFIESKMLLIIVHPSILVFKGRKSNQRFLVEPECIVDSRGFEICKGTEQGAS